MDRIVAEQIETVLAEAEQNGSGYPQHVRHEFERKTAPEDRTEV